MQSNKHNLLYHYKDLVKFHWIQRVMHHMIQHVKAAQHNWKVWCSGGSVIPMLYDIILNQSRLTGGWIGYNNDTNCNASDAVH